MVKILEETNKGGWSRMGQDGAGRSRTEQDKAGWGRTGQDRAGEVKTGQELSQEIMWFWSLTSLWRVPEFKSLL